ncbi:MAG: succinate dehydrogenase, hydrophobic membrane anchor protein [Xanthomonadales bacterium PRO7]|jgi:succinate dehydrogenase / fumarate reductase membrane anchor subunit|nr:succinate dehydrogenase, hydrophobic membrane anchor protein [Xanthomonadales bacterium PRO7]HMM56231.1 succinate dehydrogenase, hydrophobic membrane anchor protein [Rudaea sp.]
MNVRVGTDDVRGQLRNPMKYARGLGSAQSGVRHWWLQRLTAVALAPLSLWFLWLCAGLVHADYAAVRAAIAEPVHAVLLVALVVSLFWHGALGLQVVIEDYVHTRWQEITLQILVRFGAFLAAVACLFAIVRIALH